MSARTEPLALGGAGVTTAPDHHLQVDDQRGQHRDERDPQREPRVGLLGLDGRRAHDAQRRPTRAPATGRRSPGSRAPRPSWPRAPRPTSPAGDHPRPRPLPRSRCSPTASSSTAPRSPSPTTPAWSSCRCSRTPLPTTTIKAEVFVDVTEANGQYDPGEDGLSGWSGQASPTTSARSTPTSSATRCARSTSSTTRTTTASRTRARPSSSTPTSRRPSPTWAASASRATSTWTASSTRPTRACTPAKGLDPTLARGELTIPNLGTNRYAMSMVAADRRRTGSRRRPSRATTTGTPGRWRAPPATTPSSSSPASRSRPSSSATSPAPLGATGTTRPPVRGRRHRHDQGRRRRRGHLHPAEGRPQPADPGLLRRQDRPPDRQAVDHAVRPQPRRHRGVRRPRQRRRHVPDQQRPRRHLHADLLGRAAGLHPRPAVSVTVANGETVDMGMLPLAGWFTKFDGYVFNDLEPQRQAGRRRARRPELRADAAQARELADGPRRDRGDHRPVRPLRDGRTPIR